MIPEWLSFQNEFIPPYVSLYLFTWYRDKISSPDKSFRNEFISVFNPNEILVLVWYFILVSCKLKTNSIPRWKRKPCSLGRVAHAYHFQNGGQNGCFQDGWAGQFCHVNAVRTSFWNGTHSGMKLILVSCQQSLIAFGGGNADRAQILSFFYEGNSVRGIPLPLNDVNSDMWCCCGSKSIGVRNRSVFYLTFEEAGAILKNGDVTREDTWVEPPCRCVYKSHSFLILFFGKKFISF